MKFLVLLLSFLLLSGCVEKIEPVDKDIAPEKVVKPKPTPVAEPESAPVPKPELPKVVGVAPVLISAQLVASDYVLTWKLPDGTVEKPGGGYDSYIDSKDGGEHFSNEALTRSFSDLDSKEKHCFKIEARWIQLEPKEFFRSNEICVDAVVVSEPIPIPIPIPIPTPTPTPTPTPNASSSASLHSFRVTDSSKNRVYFDSDSELAGSSVAGFVVSGKRVSSIRINTDKKTGHYFTVSDDFNFWDNNTIRYTGGSNLKDQNGQEIKDFTLRYIKNNIKESESTMNYYVNNDISMSGNGLTEKNAFKRINEAMSIARAGSTVWVKAGNYGSEKVVFKNSGVAGKPIKLIGYQSKPGDNPKLVRSVGMKFNASIMPLLSGKRSGVGITTTSKYVIVRNFQVINYEDQIMPNGRNLNYGVFDNVYLEGGVAGIYINDGTSGNVRFINSYSANHSSKSIRFQNKHNLIDNSWAVTSKVSHMDYYFCIYGGKEGGNNIVRNGYIHRFIDDTHTGHGVTLKGGKTTYKHEYNLIEDMEIINSKNGSIEFRHSPVKYNVARGIYIHHESTDYKKYGFQGINFENGASYNIVENSLIKGGRSAFAFTENEEDGSSTQPGGEYNTIKNTIILGAENGISAGSPTVNRGNKWINCTFHNNKNLLSQKYGTSSNMLDATNEIINSSISKSSLLVKYGKPNPKFSYSNFFDNGFRVPSGKNNISVDPEFVNASSGDFHLAEGSQCIDAGDKRDDITQDYDGSSRSSGSTHDIGAFEFK